MLEKWILPCFELTRLNKANRFFFILLKEPMNNQYKFKKSIAGISTLIVYMLSEIIKEKIKLNKQHRVIFSE